MNTSFSYFSLNLEQKKIWTLCFFIKLFLYLITKKNCLGHIHPQFSSLDCKIRKFSHFILVSKFKNDCTKEEQLRLKLAEQNLHWKPLLSQEILKWQNLSLKKRKKPDSQQKMKDKLLFKTYCTLVPIKKKLNYFLV